MAATAGSFCRRCGRGYTLVEMLTTVAVLVIVLGLMVSLSRHVRVESATALTKNILLRLDAMAIKYERTHGGAGLPLPGIFDGDPHPNPLHTPDPHPGPPPAYRERGEYRERGPDEADLYHLTRSANLQLVRFLRVAKLLSAGEGAELPITVYDGTTLRDAWGNPVIYMPTQHPAIGMDPRGGERGFFFSAGPDGKYMTIKDNLYSYEAWAPEPGPYR